MRMFTVSEEPLNASCVTVSVHVEEPLATVQVGPPAVAPFFITVKVIAPPFTLPESVTLRWETVVAAGVVFPLVAVEFTVRALLVLPNRQVDAVQAPPKVVVGATVDPL